MENIIPKPPKGYNISNRRSKKVLIVVSISILILLFLVAGAFCYIKYIRGPFIIHKVYPSISNNTFYTIHDINQQKLSPGIYNTEGYVIYKTEDCYPCPRGHMCSTCERPQITISEKVPGVRGRFPTTESEIIINTDGNKQIEYGKKYQFSIEIDAPAFYGAELVGLSIIE